MDAPGWTLTNPGGVFIAWMGFEVAFLGSDPMAMGILLKMIPGKIIEEKNGKGSGFPSQSADFNCSLWGCPFQEA